MARKKVCCWGKGFDWEEDEAGTPYKSVPISPESANPESDYLLEAAEERACLRGRGDYDANG